MTPTIFLAAATLITVTYDGHVGALKFDTPRMCEQAKSLATTGMTLEDAQKRRQAEVAYFQRIQRDLPGGGVMVQGASMSSPTTNIKTAECVIEPPKHPVNQGTAAKP